MDFLTEQLNILIEDATFHCNDIAKIEARVGRYILTIEKKNKTFITDVHIRGKYIIRKHDSTREYCINTANILTDAIKTLPMYWKGINCNLNKYYHEKPCAHSINYNRYFSLNMMIYNGLYVKNEENDIRLVELFSSLCEAFFGKPVFDKNFMQLKDINEIAEMPTLMLYIPDKNKWPPIRQEARFITEVPDLLDEIVIDIFKVTPSMLRYFISQSPQFIEKVVRVQPNAIGYIRYPTKGMQVKAVSINASSIRLIENPDVDVMTRAIERDANAIRFIPHHLLSFELVRKAIWLNPNVIKHLKNTRGWTSHNLNAIFDFAIGINPYVIRYHQFRTPEMCRQLIELNALYLKYLKSNEITKELCSLATQKNPNAIEFVPVYFKEL